MDNNNQNPLNSQSPQYNNNQSQIPYNSPEENKSGKNLAVASLVLSLVSMFCCGLPCSIAGVVCGVMSKKKQPQNNGMAIAGIVISIVSIVIWLIALVFMLCVGSYS